MKTYLVLQDPDGTTVRELDVSDKTAQEVNKIDIEALRNMPLGSTSRLVEMVGGGEVLTKENAHSLAGE